MGVSTDAIIAFGWDLGDYPELDFLDDTGYDVGGQIELYLLRNVVKFTESWEPGIDKAYFDRKRDAENSLGVEIIYHCSDEYPMYFLAALGSETRAWRGTPVIIGSEHPIEIQWQANLYKAADALGLKDLPFPSWQLFSMWG